MLTSLQTPWEHAVYAVADRARLALGEESHTRIDKAVQIVLSGGVTLHPDGSAVVASQSRPLTGYSVNGSCACPDFEHAPSHLCKHRMACYIVRRAMEQAEPDGEKFGENMPNVAPLPEAPASINVRLTIHGKDVQVTLRGHDEMAVLDRLEKILQRYA